MKLFRFFRQALKRFPAAVAAGCALSVLAHPTHLQAEDIRIVLVGDSTVADDARRGTGSAHLNSKGDVLFARLEVEALRGAVPELAPMLLTEPRAAAASAQLARFDAVVNPDGSGTYTTLQEAIAAAPEDSTTPFRVLLKPGKYEGQILVPKTKRNLHFVGEDLEKTVITYDLNVYETNSATNMKFKGTGMIVLADDFRAENLTIENTSGDHGQALALRVDGDRAVFIGCRLLGWQDTALLEKGRQYFTNCYIEGRVDFIFGSATAVFDRCRIHSKNGGHITAASTEGSNPYGLVFLDCQLTGDSTPWRNPTNHIAAKPGKIPLATLGRPWRPHASVTYIRCEMGDHIKPVGWDNWGKESNEQTARYAEYKSQGPGAHPGLRAAWARQLTDSEAQAFTIENIFRRADTWIPDVRSR